VFQLRWCFSLSHYIYVKMDFAFCSLIRLVTLTILNLK